MELKQSHIELEFSWKFWLIAIVSQMICVVDFQQFDAIERHQNRKGPVEGAIIVDDVIGSDFAEVLTACIDALAKHQERSGGVDYHPHSNGIVRDLVHPGLNSYVKRGYSIACIG